MSARFSRARSWMPIPRGGSTSGGVLSADLKFEISAEHEAECDATPYWTEFKAASSESGEAFTPPEFDSHALDGWVLPDFNPILQQDNKIIHVTKEPLFTEEECHRKFTFIKRHLLLL